MGKALVSVIMANFNTKIAYLKESMDSILSQTYSNLEFIIVDDASTDDSLSFIKDYDDNRIKLIVNQNNLGLTASLNKAISISKGKYIARMDSDDISLPYRIERQVQFMDKHPDVIVCGTWFEKFGDENAIRKPIIDDSDYYRCQLLFSNTPITICHPSVMMRKTLLDNFHIYYDESIKKSQDYAMWVECSKYGEIAIMNEVLLRYRTHTSQISSDRTGEQAFYSDLISRKQLEMLGIGYQEEEKMWRYDIVNSRKDYLSFYDWINRIVEANGSKCIFNQNSLIKYTNQKLTNSLRRMKRIELIKILIYSNRTTQKIILNIFKEHIRKRFHR